MSAEGAAGLPDPFWIGRALADSGAISPEQLASAKRLWRKNPRESFAAALETLGLASARQIAALVAGLHGLPIAELGGAPDRSAVRLLPREAARRRCVLPYRLDGERLRVAVEDPAAYGESQARTDFPNHRVCLEVAPRREILGAIEEAWRPAASAAGNAQELFERLVRDAAVEGATDLHLEPRENAIDVRHRIDGRLAHRAFVEGAQREALVQAAKIAGRMDIAERRLPQDGQGSMAIGARRYHLRFSCIQAVNGESVVVRLIDEDAGVRSFEEMGLSSSDAGRLLTLATLPHGLVYVTGPTGSGKTTLLYSMLHNLPAHRINEMKIVTLEEPVEIRQPRFLLQADVDERVGRTFEELLRHALRHDPDVLLIGETRDRATAEITLRAALAGRLCLSTLHTNNALGAVIRLADIGLDSLMLASALKGVIAQRLVRRPCPQCSRPHPQRDLLRKRFEPLLRTEGAFPEPSFLAVETGRDCAACRGRGYRGRSAIIEIRPLAGFERLIAERAPQEKLQAAARAAGGRTLFEDGVLKAARGLATIEEVYATVEEDERTSAPPS